MEHKPICDTQTNLKCSLYLLLSVIATVHTIDFRYFHEKTSPQWSSSPLMLSVSDWFLGCMFEGCAVSLDIKIEVEDTIAIKTSLLRGTYLKEDIPTGMMVPDLGKLPLIASE